MRHPTPNVRFAYDQHFPRSASMTNGNGTTAYSYVPVGALQLLQEQIPLANSAVTYNGGRRGRGRRAEVVAADLAAGRLVRLLDFELPSPFSYWAARPPSRQDELVDRFCNWFVEEVLTPNCTFMPQPVR
jgi:DNA-binding transcriptional LysR family regulator